MKTSNPQTERLLWSASAGPAAVWQALHDRVMGGRSEGTAQPQALSGNEPAHVIFAGQISRDNGGGFASFRLGLPTATPIGAAQTALITLRGDGEPFKLCLHRQSDWDGVQWQADFVAPDTWTTLTMPLALFEPRRRGRPMSERPLASGDALLQIGLMTVRPEPGPFWLAVAQVALR
jgi:NADH dehydrogenase [ubiquinone] 1 alpha subcomplex assembly factor 1